MLAVAAYLVAMLGGVAAAVLLAIAGRRSAAWLSAVAASMLVAGVVGGSGFAGLRSQPSTWRVAATPPRPTCPLPRSPARRSASSLGP